MEKQMEIFLEKVGFIHIYGESYKHEKWGYVRINKEHPEWLADFLVNLGMNLKANEICEILQIKKYLEE